MVLAEQEMVDYYTVESVGTSDDEGNLKGSKETQRQERRVELTESASGIGWKFANQGMPPLFHQFWIHVLIR